MLKKLISCILIIITITFYLPIQEFIEIYNTYAANIAYENGGVTYTYNGTTTLTITGSGEITNIWKNSTKLRDYVSSIEIITFNSKDLTSIGDNAFSNMELLKTINYVAHNITSIGNNAFSSCISLSSVIIPNTVTVIGSYAFQNCTTLKTLKFASSSKCTQIKSYAFSGCSELGSITLPVSITLLGERAFEGLANDSIAIKEFAYKNSVQTFTAPYTGKYNLEIWGAQGGGSLSGGGYSYGYINLNAGDKLYIYTGGAGSFSNSLNRAGGYNGGGASLKGAGSGGGATHIATTNRGVLSNYENYKEEVIMVAGGSGGKGSAMADKSTSITYSSDNRYQNVLSAEDASYLLSISGNGGGLSPDGWTASRVNGVGSVFSTDWSTHKFGIGEDGKNTNYYNGNPGAGGGGWEGGTINRGDGIDGYDSTYSTGILGGSGGSGYLNNKMLYGQGTVKGTKENVGNQGNGKAKITYEGPVQTTLTIDTKEYGTINGNSGKVVIKGDAGTSIPFPQLISEDGYRLTRYKQIDGTIETDENGYVSYKNVPENYEFTFKNTILEANYKAKILINITKQSDTEYNMNIVEPDEYAKYYKVFESTNNGETWEPMQTETDRDTNKENYSKKFNYTGEIQEYMAPIDGYYYFEATGASGICDLGTCASVEEIEKIRGGYSTGYRFLQKGQTVYIAVGGKGISRKGARGIGGWNGGGNGNDHSNRINGGGGGATSWTTSLIKDGQLKNYINNKEDVIIVAGGSGGLLHSLSHAGKAGQGGGLTGGNGNGGAVGGTQGNAGSRRWFWIWRKYSFRYKRHWWRRRRLVWRRLCNKR